MPAYQTMDREYLNGEHAKQGVRIHAWVLVMASQICRSTRTSVVRLLATMAYA